MHPEVLAPDATSIDLTARHLLPFPLAALYRAMRTSRTDRERLDRSLRLVEGIVRFLALVALSDAIDRTRVFEQRRKWLRLLHQTGSGKLAALWKQTSEFLAREGDAFVPEFTVLIDSAWEHSLGAIIDGRNDIVHRDEVRAEGDARRALRALEPDLHVVLDGIAFLADYQLGVATDLRDSGRERSYQWCSSRGADESAEPIPLRGHGTVATDVALLVHPRTQRALRLAPFVHWGNGLEHSGNHFWWLARTERENESAPRASYAHATLRGVPEIARAGDFASPDGAHDRSLDLGALIATIDEWPRRFALDLDADSAARLVDGGRTAKLLMRAPTPPASDAAPPGDERRSSVPRARIVVTASLALTAVALCFVALTYARQGTAPDQRVAPPPAPATASALSPPTARATRPATPRAPCTARSNPQWAFHLRTRPECHSEEREYPGGQTFAFDVLGDAPLDRGPQRLYRVRVVDTGEIGYVFMRPDELAGECLVAWRAPRRGTECR